MHLNGTDYLGPFYDLLHLLTMIIITFEELRHRYGKKVGIGPFSSLDLHRLSESLQERRE
jgi:hypothetical protein